MSKSLFASKTVWFNVLTIVVSIASAHGWVPDQTLSSTVVTLLVAISPFVNLLLRFFTKKPLSLSK